MSETIHGDKRTFAHHVLTLNLDQIFHHDLPKATGFADKEAKVLREGWEKLDVKLQDALLHGTGILQTIGEDLEAAPSDILNKILANFTDITKEDLQAWLVKVQGVFTGIAAIPDQDAETTIKNLQDYIKSKVDEGSKLGGILSVVSQVLATVINPDAIIAQVATYAETAYQIIKSIFGKK